jgi:hypothetical protein
MIKYCPKDDLWLSLIWICLFEKAKLTEGIKRPANILPNVLANYASITK